MNENEKLKKILDEKEVTDAQGEENSYVEKTLKEFENISKKNFEILKFMNKQELILLIDKLNKEDNLTKIIDEEIKHDTFEVLKNVRKKTSKK
ncbi:conserved protein, unknown function [Plasmodium ovale curtisi]|uniref:Uncharacterized protein n=1 Tax=Plasmodium ovale curtisi TaxID=864141 RepID=A0A1A8W9D1_PLAOA|nr:conserved protein, unknown function [Plasmodium ovale curtisi]